MKNKYLFIVAIILVVALILGAKHCTDNRIEQLKLQVEEVETISSGKDTIISSLKNIIDTCDVQVRKILDSQEEKLDSMQQNLPTRPIYIKEKIRVRPVSNQTDLQIKVDSIIDSHK